MDIEKLKELFHEAAAVLEAEEDMLSAVDAETGDGDHGVTVAKIARAIMSECNDGEADTPSELFGDISAAIMAINGGSAGPLWAMMFDGMSEACEGVELLEAEHIGQIFTGAVDGLATVSDARPGMKTMVDALVPAAEAAEESAGETEDILLAAAEAAEAGMEATRDMTAAYGRAKNLKEDSIGHLDAGAVSAATMIRAIYSCYCNLSA